MAEIDIEIAAEGWSVLPEAESLARGAVEAALAGGGLALRRDVALSLLLTDDEAVRTMNRRWRGQDKPTNVLSFQAVPRERLAGAPYIGDVALAFETVAREAGEDGKDLSAHLAHLVVHGVLHLLGYDHEDEAEAEAMEGLERQVLAGLGLPDPYPALDG